MSVYVDFNVVRSVFWTGSLSARIQKEILDKAIEANRELKREVIDSETNTVCGQGFASQKALVKH